MSDNRMFLTSIIRQTEKDRRNTPTPILDSVRRAAEEEEARRAASGSSPSSDYSNGERFYRDYIDSIKPDSDNRSRYIPFDITSGSAGEATEQQAQREDPSKYVAKVYSPEYIQRLIDEGMVTEENGEYKWADGWNENNFRLGLSLNNILINQFDPYNTGNEDAEAEEVSLDEKIQEFELLVEEAKEEANRLSAEYSSIVLGSDEEDFDFDSHEKAVYAKEKELQDSKSRLATLEAYLAEYKQLSKLEKYNAYTKEITAKEDYLQNSKYSPLPSLSDEQLKAAGYSQSPEGNWHKQKMGIWTSYRGEDDPVYTFINDQSQRKRLLLMDRGNYRTDQYTENGYHLLTADEIGAYNYLYHQDRINGTNTAEIYLANIGPMLRARAMEEEAGFDKENSKKNKAFSSLFSFGTNFVNTLMFPTKALAAATGNYDSSPELDRYGNRTQAIRGSVSEDMGSVGKLLYGGAMTIGDMAVAFATAGGNAKLVQAVMSSSAGSSAISAAKNSGASDGKAFIIGLGTAAIEWTTERYSIDAILKKPKTILGYLATNTVTEATEEGTSNLAGVALDTVVSAVFGERNEIQQRIDELIVYGEKTPEEALKIAFIEKAQSLGEDVLIGGMTGLGMSSAVLTSSMIQNSIKQRDLERQNTIQNNKTIDSLINDERALLYVIEQGKASGGNTAQIAAEVEAAVESGEVTRSQVKKLVVSIREAGTNKWIATADNLQAAANQSQIKGNEPTNESSADGPATLEEAAIAVVNARNGVRSATSAEQLDALTSNGVSITAEEVRTVSGFGENGSKLIADIANTDGMTYSAAKEAVETAYRAGFSNVKDVSFETQTQKDAFAAGQKDFLMQLAAAKDTAKTASVYHDGVIESSEYFKKLSPQAKKMARTLAKKLGLRSEFVNRLIAAVVNGIEYEANAQHSDGVLKRADNSDNPIHEDLIHEALHRMMQVAPEETSALINELVRNAEQYGRANNSGVPGLSRFDAVKEEHDNAGISLGTLDIMEEIAAKELQTIFKSPKEFNTWIKSLEVTPQNKTNWQKFIDLLQKVIEDAKHFLSQIGMTAEKKANAQKAIEQLDNIKKMLGDALTASEKAVNELIQAENSQNDGGIKSTDRYNVSVNNSLKKNWHTGLSKTQMEKVLNDISRQGNPESKRITDTACWYKGRLNGDDYFAIYSTDDTDPDSTVLYFAKGKKAIKEFNILTEVFKEIGSGESVDKKSTYVNWVSGGGWMQQKNNIQNNSLSQRGRSNTDAGVLQRPSKRNGSGALWNVIDNLLKQPGDIISQETKVSNSLKNSKGETLTKEQAEYFKDSKARDKDGNLLVMYQGSSEDFTVFDRKKSSYSNLYGRGFYFTNSERHASQYGNAKMYYLNIKHPVSTEKTTITKAQLKKFVQAIADNDDYGIENYGYDATVSSVTESVYGKSDFLMLNDISRTAIGDLVEAVELFNEVNGTDFDGFILDTETVIFNSEQAKLTSNGTPTDNPDIRFSLKTGKTTTSKDVNELLDTIEHLKHEFEITKLAKADPRKLAAITRKLLRDYDSKAEYDGIYDAIDKLYQYMANGEDGHPALWDDVYSRAYDIASEMVENAVVTDNELYGEYKELRSYLRSTPMRFNESSDEVPSGYESFNEFRRKNMGRFKFTKDGMPIDSVYQELSTLFPEFFDATVQTDTASQLERMAEVWDEIQPHEINPYSQDIKSATAYLANDIIDRFFDVPQAKPTFADKAERRVTEARIAGNKKLEKVREENNAKIKEIIAKQREKTKGRLDKLRAEKNAKIKQEQVKRREALSKMSEKQKTKVLRARIMRHVSELSKKLLKPTDKQHIPQELQSAVAMLLESINLESNYTYDIESGSYKKNDNGLPTQRTKAFGELRDIYEKMASDLTVDPNLMGAEGLLSNVISLADKRIADMTSAELETVWQTIRAIEATISNVNKSFASARFTTISEVAEKLRADNADKKAKRELKVKFGGLLQKLTTLDMLTPETFLHYLGNAGDEMFRMMRNAQDKHISIMKAVADFTRKELKGVNVNKLEKEVHTVTLGGQEVKLTTAQLMELYVLMKRKQAADHILVGGILPDEIDAKGMFRESNSKPIRNISMPEISAALSILTDEQKKIAETLQKFVSTTLSEYGNQASMQVYGYEKFNEENYWTIRTNKQEIASDPGKDNAVTTISNKGFTIGTKPHANTSLNIGSIFDTFASHASEMATYAAWLGTSEDINRIRNFVFWEDGARTGTVKEILETIHGKQGPEYLQKLLTDISIGVKGTDNMNPFDKLTGSYKAASVGANLRVIIQQPTAIIRALDMINPVYLVKGAIRPLKGWETAKKYAPIAQWKDWGHFDINTGRQMKDVLFDNATLGERLRQAGMWGASMADSISWGMLWNAVEAEIKATHKEIEAGSDEYYKAVAERFTQIVDHTQVVDGILQRSQIMRNSDSSTKRASSFMGEPTKQYNMAMAAAYDVRMSKGEAKAHAIDRLGRTAITLAITGIVNACAQSFIDALRDDDKEKDYWEKWLGAFVGSEEDAWFQVGGNLGDILNPLSYVPFVKDILSAVQGYDVNRMDIETISKLVKSIGNMSEAVSGTGKYTIAKASAALFADIARIYGVPVANIKRDVKSIATTVAIETDNYLMQYRMEKAMLNINYEGNRKNYMDILYNAYMNDREAYEFIYNDLLKSGYDSKTIKSNMEERMKKAEGITEASEFSKRYMPPDIEKTYDKHLEQIKSNDLWGSATEQQQRNAEADLYDLLTSTSEEMEEKRTRLDKYKIDDVDYVLWELAKEMSDKPTKSGNYGTYTQSEFANALLSMDVDNDTAWALYLSENDTDTSRYVYDSGVDAKTYMKYLQGISKAESDGNLEKSEVVDVISEMNIHNDTAWALYLSKYDGKSAIEAEKHGINAKLFMTAVVDMDKMTADYDSDGKVISGSRRSKIERYLDSVCGSYKEYLFLLGTEYDSVKDDDDYIKYFGK